MRISFKLGSHKLCTAQQEQNNYLEGKWRPALVTLKPAETEEAL